MATPIEELAARLSEAVARAARERSEQERETPRTDATALYRRRDDG